ncbi:MAG: Glu/Leu/Phe/Val dehydrogenase [Candidatus Manganitrophus sp.]|nr:MAG: Glu/Leu/Phe/Val dehydrogenase [Candidatus Manganitrophus sp.]
MRSRRSSLRRGQGGVRCDPKALSRNELQRLTRRYTAEIFPIIGPDQDIPAPDVGTNEQVMAWIMDTYSQFKGYSVAEVVTGKPISIGGSLGREEATGRGLFVTILEAMRHLNLPVTGSTAIIQGFGNVGRHAARMLSAHGIQVIGVSDSKGAIYDPRGLDLARLLPYKEQTESVVGFPGADPISTEDLLEQPCTVLIPAALAGAIHIKNAGRLRCRILAEGANGPTDLDADVLLNDRGIFILPDILANAGGGSFLTLNGCRICRTIFGMRRKYRIGSPRSSPRRFSGSSRGRSRKRSICGWPR